MSKPGYVYILSNKNKTTLYVGVTSLLRKRIYEHKTHFHKGSFSDKYNLEFLVYFEFHNSIVDAIAREKQLNPNYS